MGHWTYERFARIFSRHLQPAAWNIENYPGVVTPQQLADDLSIDVRELRTWLRANHRRPAEDRGKPWRITSAIERDARIAFGQPPSFGTDLRNVSSDVKTEISELASEVAATVRGARQHVRQAVNDVRNDLRAEADDDSPTP